MPNPAARQSDLHVCNISDPVSPAVKGSCWKPDIPAVLVPHVGGPIIGGSPDVFIDKLPAARCGDKTLCIPVNRHDLIVTGPAEIKINGVLAAMVTSISWHTNTITTGSPSVNYGGAMVGATLGNAEASTAACKKAAESREKYQREAKAAKETEANTTRTPKSSDKFDQSQGKPNNCGQETVRQLCLQRCLKEGPASKACAACNYDEDQWYQRYLQDDEIKQGHKESNKDRVEKIRHANDERWRKIKDASPIWQKGGTVKASELPATWEAHQGQNFKLGHERTSVTIQLLPPDIDDPAQATSGKVGSYDNTRATMLKKWCGIDDARPGAADLFSVGDDVATGNDVAATVEVNTLYDEPDASGYHVVTVSQMEFGPDGKLKWVTLNDTSAKDGCGKRFSGSAFQNALAKGGGTTNVVPKGTTPST